MALRNALNFMINFLRHPQQNLPIHVYLLLSLDIIEYHAIFFSSSTLFSLANLSEVCVKLRRKPGKGVCIMLKFDAENCGKLDPPEPLYVAKARQNLMQYAKNHPELPLLLKALEEAAAFSSRMRAMWREADSGPVRAVLGGRYGLVNACEDACSDISGLAWDWADDEAWPVREERHRYD